MADLNQFLNQDPPADDMHSNGYANVAGGAGAGGLSMEQRRKLLNQPRVVGAYQQSRLGRQGSSAKARTANQTRGAVYDPSNDSVVDDGTPGNRQHGGINDAGQVDSQSIEKRQHFVEPSQRPKPQGYNPFA